METFTANLFFALCLQLELDTHGRHLERIWRDAAGRLRRTWR